MLLTLLRSWLYMTRLSIQMVSQLVTLRQSMLGLMLSK